MRLHIFRNSNVVSLINWCDFRDKGNKHLQLFKFIYVVFFVEDFVINCILCIFTSFLRKNKPEWTWEFIHLKTFHHL